MTSSTIRISAAAVLWAAAALLAAAGVAGCASTGAVADPERRFYEARCGVCHAPWAKSDFPAAAWPAIVAEFAPRAGLSASQRERILRYLTAPAPAPAER